MLISAQDALRVGVLVIPTLPDHITHVIALSAKKKMIGSNAVSNVASMQTVQAGQYQAKAEFVSKSVCSGFSSNLKGELSITFVVNLSCPEPALIRFQDSRPEAFSKRSAGTRMLCIAKP